MRNNNLSYIIHHTPSQDSVLVYASTIEGIREEAFKEMKKRGWKEEDCWSEEGQ